MTATPAITTDAVGISENGRSKTAGVVDQLIAPMIGTNVEDIDVTRLHEHPDNPRGDVGDVSELADSIRASGIFEPLIVVPASAWQEKDDRLPAIPTTDFVIVAGHRRAAAARAADRRTVPCLVREDLTGPAAEIAMLVENVQREDLSPVQEARGFANLEAQGMSQREIARLTGKLQPHVSKRLALLKLPDDLQQKIGQDEHGLSVQDAVELSKVADDPKTLKAVLKRPSWQSIEEATKAAVEDREREVKLEERKTQLRNAGITNILKYPTYGFDRHTTPLALRFLEEDGVDIAEHEHFACHAVAVGYTYTRDLKVEPVCTNPKAHPESKAAQQTAERDKREAQAEREKARAAKRALERRALITTLCKAPAAETEHVALAALVDEQLEYFYDDDLAALAEVLGIESVPDDDGDAGLEAKVRAFAAVDAKSTRRFIVASQLLLIDGRAYHDQAAGYLSLLQSRGYKLDRDERATIAKNGSKPAPVEIPPPGYPVACAECEHEQPVDGCDCPTCFCNPVNVDEPVGAVTG